MIQPLGTETAKATAQYWERLMLAAQQGDANAYRTLLAELIPWLRRYFMRRLPPAMIDDAVQDVLLAIHEKRHTYDPTRAFGPWLVAIAHYKWVDRLRSLKIQATEPLDETISTPDHEDDIIAGTTLDQLLAALKPAQAKAIRLVKLEGHSIDEVSQAMGQSASLIKINIHRGLKKLADLIGVNHSKN